MNFIIALGQCVLAGGFAQWYFTYQKEVREVFCPSFLFLFLMAWQLIMMMMVMTSMMINYQYTTV